MPFLIPVLALAIFAQGTSEFMLAGLLIPLASDLGVSPATAGLLTSAFAVGMVIGAPAMAAVGSRWHPRRSLVLLLIVFIAAHIVGVLAPSFELLLVTRVVAALANAGFLAISLATVRALVPAARTTRAIAALLAGTTLATIVGVPGGAALASAFGWRATFWAVVLLCVPALAALLLNRSLAGVTDAPRLELRREVAALARGPVLTAMVLAVLVNAATFGVFTFLGVVGVEVGVAEPAVPVMLAVFGVGAFLGVTATGRWAAPVERLWVGLGAVALTAAWAATAVLGLSAAGLNTAGLFVAAALGGALSFAVGSALIARIVREASDAPVLGGAFATVALNLGAALGPVAAGSAFEAAGAPGVLGAASVATGLAALIAAIAIRLTGASGAPAQPRR